MTSRITIFHHAPHKDSIRKGSNSNTINCLVILKSLGCSTNFTDSGRNRDVIGDIIHYFTFMSSKLTLFALFSIFRHYSLFFQKYENNVITLYTFQNFRLFSTISAGEIGSQGSWPLASCSQLRASSRER